MEHFSAAILAYILGAIPTGIIIARLYKIDLTKEGSGNVGASNVARIIGKKAGIMTLVIDILKAVLAIYLVSILFAEELKYLAAYAVVCGHCFSIPAISKGGKGVATALGAVLALKAILVIPALLVFGLVFYLYHIVSVASLAACILTSICALAMDPKLAMTLAIITLVVTYRHKDNIIRLINKEEKKFSFKK